jgi:hypothetical protein
MNDILDSDIKFTMYLATVNPARFNDYEFRLFRFYELAKGSN